MENIVRLSGYFIPLLFSSDAKTPPLSYQAVKFNSKFLTKFLTKKQNGLSTKIFIQFPENSKFVQ